MLNVWPMGHEWPMAARITTILIIHFLSSGPPSRWTHVWDDMCSCHAIQMDMHKMGVQSACQIAETLKLLEAVPLEPHFWGGTTFWKMHWRVLETVLHQMAFHVADGLKCWEIEPVFSHNMIVRRNKVLSMSFLSTKQCFVIWIDLNEFSSANWNCQDNVFLEKINNFLWPLVGHTAPKSAVAVAILRHCHCPSRPPNSFPRLCWGFPFPGLPDLVCRPLKT